MYKRAYSFMIYCQSVRKGMDKEKSDFDDQYNVEDINAMLTRLTNVD